MLIILPMFLSPFTCSLPPAASATDAPSFPCLFSCPLQLYLFLITVCLCSVSFCRQAAHCGRRIATGITLGTFRLSNLSKKESCFFSHDERTILRGCYFSRKITQYENKSGRQIVNIWSCTCYLRGGVTRFSLQLSWITNKL